MAAVLLLWGVLLSAWLVLHWIILPHIDEWRPAIERRLGDALGAPVRIGHIEVRSSGWVPALSLRDLRVLDAQGRDALRLAQVSTALSARSLLSWRLRFEQVLVDGAQLEVRRDAAGGWHLAGFDLGGFDVGPGDSRLLDWVFEQHELVIRDGRVRWLDEQRGGPPLLLQQVSLVLRNGLRRHAIRVDATPPPNWGAPVSLRGRFTRPLLSRAGDWRRWSGTLYVDAPRTDVDAVSHALDLNPPLRSDAVALRAWLDIRRGFVRAATLDVAASELAVQFAAAPQGIALGALQGRLDAKRDSDGVRLHWRRSAPTGAAAPGGDLTLAWQQKQRADALWAAQQPVSGGEFGADRLDLAVLAEIAAQWPIDSALRAQLAEVAPRGQLVGLKAGWSGEPRAPLGYRIEGQVAGLSLQAAAAPKAGERELHFGRPGVHGVDLRFHADQNGGDATLAMRDGALVFPGVWADPTMAIGALDAALQWRVERSPAAPPRIDLQVTKARFENADMAGEFDARWHTAEPRGGPAGARFPGELQLSGSLSRAQPQRVWRYLPLGIAAVARDYVRASIRGGSASARFKVQGNLYDFPFKSENEGVFRVDVQARDLDFAYLPAAQAAVPDWPAFSEVSGDLVFDRSAMQFRGARAQLWGLQIAGVDGDIADLGAARPLLSLQGKASGPAADLLRYLRVTPLGPWIGATLDPLSASGAADLRLALQMPLADPRQATVDGSVSLDGNEVRVRSDLPPLKNARGRIDFTRDSFRLQPTTARWLGGDLSVEGGSAADGVLRFTAHGVADVAGWREWSAVPQGAAALLKRLSGRSAFRASLDVADGTPAFSVSSDLVGLAIDLPAPLRKGADTAWPSSLQVAPAAPASGASGARQQSLKLDIGAVLRAAYVRDAGTATPRVLRGGIGVLEAAPTPASGVAARLKLGVVDVDAWQAVLDSLDDGTGDGGGDGVSDDSASAYWPRSIQLQAQELRAGARQVTNLVATLHGERSARDTRWQVQLSADQLSGEIDYRRPLADDVPGGVRARLQRLSLPPNDVAGVEDLLSRPPARVPALDVVVDDFELRGRKLGRLEVQAVNAAARSGGAARWQVDKLQLRMPEAVLNASGGWTAGADARMSLDFDLALADGGAFAARLGAPGALRGGKGNVLGKVSWQGSPFSLDYPSLNGSMSVALQAGQLLQADPGASRLLGVFSLQALPRRLLAFDFRDIFAKGFAFDTVNGELDIDAGVARTDNLRMLGVQAAVLMRGSADLNHETQDLQVLIVPNIDASGAALATAVINPAIGLGALLAQWAFKEPLRAAGTRQYHITGPWADPQVERVEREPDSPLPKIEPAPPSAPIRAPSKVMP